MKGRADGLFSIFCFAAGASSFLSGQAALRDSVGVSLPLSKCFPQNPTCVYVCLNTVI